MALRDLRSLEYDDGEKYDRAKAMTADYEPPDYPQGCCFSIPLSVLKECGADGGEPGDTMRFSAMGEVTSVMRGREDCRVELQLMLFAGEDGEFVEVGDGDEGVPYPMRPSICLCGPELEKMDLEADCERGDLIHLVGQARLESLSSTEYGGDMASLQITDLNYVEDESSESRKEG